MTLDTQLRSVAESTINQFGKSVTHRRTVATYNAGTGKTVDADTDTAVKVSPPTSYRKGETDGTLVQLGDAKVLLAALALTIEPNAKTDSLIIDSETWKIVDVQTIWSGELPAAYELQIRR